MADYVIIGGGVYGVAAAWRLAAAGADVVVLERKAVATGASGGPGRRGVRANGRDKAELPLMREAYPVWESLHDVLEQDGLFERMGNLKLIGRAQDLPAARAQAWLQNSFGVESHVLDAAEVRAMEPHLEAGVLGAVYCPADGASDHAKTTRAYAAAARRAGAVIREGVEATGVVYSESGDRAVGVRLADGATVEAAAGVLALSNWSVADLVRDRVQMPVWSDAFQVLLSRPLAEVPNRHVIGHASRTLALKAEAGGRVMISGGYRGAYDRETHVGVAVQASIDANVADAVATYPMLQGMAVEVADAGHLESIAVDDIPVIDRLPGCENLWFGTGWCGHGWAIAPVVSGLIAQYALERIRPDLLRPFALSRFG